MGCVSRAVQNGLGYVLEYVSVHSLKKESITGGTLRYLHMILGDNSLNLSCPSSPLQTIGWGFSLAPLKAFRKPVDLTPWAL